MSGKLLWNSRVFPRLSAPANCILTGCGIFYIMVANMGYSNFRYQYTKSDFRDSGNVHQWQELLFEFYITDNTFCIQLEWNWNAGTADFLPDTVTLNYNILCGFGNKGQSELLFITEVWAVILIKNPCLTTVFMHMTHKHSEILDFTHVCMFYRHKCRPCVMQHMYNTVSAFCATAW